MTVMESNHHRAHQCQSESPWPGEIPRELLTYFNAAPLFNGWSLTNMNFCLHKVHREYSKKNLNRSYKQNLKSITIKK